jgi:hypothetical protein
VRVKNAIGIRCTWSKSATRRSKISPSPIREEYHRCSNDSSAPANARPIAARASVVTMPRSSLGTASSMSERSRMGGSAPATAAPTTATRNPTRRRR